MKKTGILMLILSAALAGCGFGARTPAPDLYVLKADVEPLEHCRKLATVQVSMPDAAPGLESSRVAVFDTPTHLNYYTGARWATQVPDMVQAFLAEAFTEAQVFKSVSTGLDDVPPSLKVLVDIRRFEVEGVDSPKVHIAMTARIVSAQDGHLLETVPFETTVTPDENHMPSIVKAFNHAMNDAAEEITDALADAAGICRK